MIDFTNVHTDYLLRQYSLLVSPDGGVRDLTEEMRRMYLIHYVGEELIRRGREADMVRVLRAHQSPGTGSGEPDGGARA